MNLLTSYFLKTIEESSGLSFLGLKLNKFSCFVSKAVRKILLTAYVQAFHRFKLVNHAKL